MNGKLSDTDNQLLRAWRRGELDEATAQAFETRLFFEPALLRAAELDQGLEDGLRRTPRAANEDRAERPRYAWSSRHGHRQPVALLLAAGLGALAVLPFARMTPESGALRGNVEWVSVDVRRGAAVEPVLVAPRASTGLVAMELPAPAGSSGPYAVVLRAVGDEARTFDLTGLQATDGIISLAFAREALAAGEYRIEIRHAAGGDVPLGPQLGFRYRPE